MKQFFHGVLLTGIAATTAFVATPSQAADWDTCGMAGEVMAKGSLNLWPGSCQIGDKIYTFSKGADTDLPDSTEIMISEFSGTQHTIIAQNGSGLIGTKFNYTISVAPSVTNWYLKQWTTDTASSLFGASYQVNTSPTNSADPAVTITIPGDAGPKGPYNFNPNVTSSYFSNMISNGAVPVQQITNTIIQVPGPLPIVGAATIFGFSRKLRTRIKATV
jgi:hypothetical protein